MDVKWDKGLTHRLTLALVSSPNFSVSLILRRGLIARASSGGYISFVSSTFGLSRWMIMLAERFRPPGFGRVRRIEMLEEVVEESESEGWWFRDGGLYGGID